MSGIIPIIQMTPKSVAVRTYLEEEGFSSDSEGRPAEEASEAEEEVDDDRIVLIADRLAQNQAFMDEQMKNGPWSVMKTERKTSDDENVMLVKQPTASKLPHRLLNPYIYRNVKNVGTLDDLATLLESPDDWRVRYNSMMADGFIQRQFNSFKNLPPSTSESDIQFNFVTLVILMMGKLQIFLESRSEVKIVVGGILARHQYDLRSSTDPSFWSAKSRALIATEVKTDRAFRMRDVWFHQSRGIQVLSAMYAFHCPTFLLTQKQWKLFVENGERNAVLTYPFDDEAENSSYVNSTLMLETNESFLMAIYICLLSRRDADDGLASEPVAATSATTNTAVGKVSAMSAIITPSKPDRQSERLASKFSALSFSAKKVPTFISGYENGAPVYSEVRVLEEQEVLELEDRIAMEEKAEYQQRTSESTLIE